MDENGSFISDDSVEEQVVAESFDRLEPNLELQNEVAMSCSIIQFNQRICLRLLLSFIASELVFNSV